MKRRKRIVCIISLSILMSFLVGCIGETDPKVTVNEFMTSLQSYNIAKPITMFESSDNKTMSSKKENNIPDVDFEDKTTNDYLKAMLTNIEYKILSVKELDDETDVEVEIKTVDIEKLMKDIYMKKAEEAYKQKQSDKSNKDVGKGSGDNKPLDKSGVNKDTATIKGPDMSNMTADDIKKMERTIVDAINTSNYIPKKVNKVNFRVVKYKGELKIKPTKEILGVIFGVK